MTDYSGTATIAGDGLITDATNARLQASDVTRHTLAFSNGMARAARSCTINDHTEKIFLILLQENPFVGRGILEERLALDVPEDGPVFTTAQRAALQSVAALLSQTDGHNLGYHGEHGLCPARAGGRST